VGRSEATAARYHLGDQSEIDVLLWWLVSGRAGAGGEWQELDPGVERGGGE
jgi:hypothetical protein